MEQPLSPVPAQTDAFLRPVALPWSATAIGSALSGKKDGGHAILPRAVGLLCRSCSSLTRLGRPVAELATGVNAGGGFWVLRFVLCGSMLSHIKIAVAWLPAIGRYVT